MNGMNAPGTWGIMDDGTFVPQRYAHTQIDYSADWAEAALVTPGGIWRNGKRFPLPSAEICRQRVFLSRLVGRPKSAEKWRMAQKIAARAERHARLREQHPRLKGYAR